NVRDNILYVEQSDDNDFLYSDALIASDVNRINDVENTFTCTAKLRYRQKDTTVHVKKLDQGKVHVTFDKKERTIMQGQAVVFDQSDVCLGGGTNAGIFMYEERLHYVG